MIWRLGEFLSFNDSYLRSLEIMLGRNPPWTVTSNMSWSYLSTSVSLISLGIERTHPFYIYSVSLKLLKCNAVLVMIRERHLLQPVCSCPSSTRKCSTRVNWPHLQANSNGLFLELVSLTPAWPKKLIQTRLLGIKSSSHQLEVTNISRNQKHHVPPGRLP